MYLKDGFTKTKNTLTVKQYCRTLKLTATSCPKIQKSSSKICDDNRRHQKLCSGKGFHASSFLFIYKICNLTRFILNLRIAKFLYVNNVTHYSCVCMCVESLYS